MVCITASTASPLASPASPSPAPPASFWVMRRATSGGGGLSARGACPAGGVGEDSGPAPRSRCFAFLMPLALSSILSISSVWRSAMASLESRMNSRRTASRIAQRRRCAVVYGNSLAASMSCSRLMV
eukprot:scaffold56369_cov59-Phaeocystis_antarctica.AAC.3